MRKILVPTDFSIQAEEALKVAAQLAERYSYEIYLMNVLDLPADTYKSSVTNTQVSEHPPESLFFMRLARQRFQKLLKKDFLSGVKVTDTVEFRRTFDGILDATEKYDIDLIVMGSSGASGLQEIFIGSNTEKVVRNSKVPVLVIKEAIEDLNIQNFVFATDFTTKGKTSFWKALKLAKRLKAELHLVYINTPNKFQTTKDLEEKMNTFTQDAPFNNYTKTVFNDYSIEEGVLSFTKSLNAELIGIATSGRKGLAHLLNGSISEDLVNHAKKPIITFRI